MISTPAAQARGRSHDPRAIAEASTTWAWPRLAAVGGIPVMTKKTYMTSLTLAAITIADKGYLGNRSSHMLAASWAEVSRIGGGDLPPSGASGRRNRSPNAPVNLAIRRLKQLLAAERVSRTAPFAPNQCNRRHAPLPAGRPQAIQSRYAFKPSNCPVWWYAPPPSSMPT